MTASTATRAILLCSSDLAKLKPLCDVVAQRGFRTVCATRRSTVHELIADKTLSAVVLDLLLADGDGISLACELRTTYPWLPVVVLTTETPASVHRPETDADWLRGASAQARLIFALKQAIGRWDGEPPSILYLEEDDQTAALMRNTLANRARLFRARSILEARIAMAMREYDIAVVNAAQVLPDRNDYCRLSGRPLAVNSAGAANPLAILIDNLRKPSPAPHSAAIC